MADESGRMKDFFFFLRGVAFNLRVSGRDLYSNVYIWSVWLFNDEKRRTEVHERLDMDHPRTTWKSDKSIDFR